MTFDLFRDKETTKLIYISLPPPRSCHGRKFCLLLKNRVISFSTATICSLRSNLCVFDIVLYFFSKFSGSFLDFRWNFVHSMNPLPHSFTSLYCTACLDKYWYWSVEWTSLRHMQHWTMSSINKKDGCLQGSNPGLPGER